LRRGKVAPALPVTATQPTMPPIGRTWWPLQSGDVNEHDFLRVIALTPLVSIDLIIRNEQGQVLLGKRLNRPAQHTWFVPGGRIRKNERVATAMDRISERELGVRVTQPKMLGVFDHLYPDNFAGAPGIDTHYVVLGFEARLPVGAKLQADDQHGELRWWPVDELLAHAHVHENTKAYFRGN
jgi:colanic acid biosynthesis protein WcaH